MYAKHAELKAGIVVVAAIVALLALLFFAYGSDVFKPKREIHIRFEQGFAAPKEGDPIEMNGMQVGTVEEVVQREERRRGAEMTDEDRGMLPPDAQEAREIYVLAKVKLHRDQLVPRGTTAEISEQITGTRKLALRPGRSTENLSDEDTHRNPIPGLQAGDFAEILRSVQTLVGRVTDLVESGEGAVADVRILLRTLQQKVEALETAEISTNIKEAAAGLRLTIDVLRTRLDAIGTEVEAAAKDVGATAREARAIAEAARGDVAKLLATLNRIATQVDELVARTAPRIDAIVGDIELAAASVRDVAGTFGGVGPRLEVLIDDAGGDIRRTAQRLAEVGRNLQDASEDIKAHPWKLLNKPPTEEIAYENLRTTTQNVVRAAGQVNDTMERLQEMLARPDLSEAERKLVNEHYETLKTQLRALDAASAVLDRLLKMGGGPPAAPLRSPASEPLVPGRPPPR